MLPRMQERVSGRWNSQQICHCSAWGLFSLVIEELLPGESTSLCFPREVWSDLKDFSCHLASSMKHLLFFRHTFNVY